LTVSSTLNRISYTGNGVTLAFAVAFPFHAQTDLVVLSTVITTGVQTTKALTTHYTISGTPDALGHYINGGSVDFLVAPAATERITIYRDPTRTQTLDLVANDNLPAESVEAQFDYQTMLIQRVSDLITRSLRQPDGDSANLTTIPSTVDRASKYLGFNAGGNPIAIEANTGGATNGTVIATGSTAARSLANRFTDHLSIEDFSDLVVGTDWTAALQAGITAVGSSGATLDLGDRAYRCTAPLLAPHPVRLMGVGVNPYVGDLGTRGIGSWLHFDHTGKGIDATPTTDSYASLTLQSLGTFRTQPTPGGGWTPTAHDFDIWTVNVDLQIDDVTLLNPTKGIYISAVAGAASYNRATISRLRGQPLQVGLEVESAFDTVDMSQIHWWPYWSTNANVLTYMRANLNALALYRADNPMLSNYFSYGHKCGIFLGQGASGRTSKLHAVNIDLDLGLYGVYVHEDTDGVTAQFTNLTVEGQPALSGTVNLYVRGDNAVMDFANTWVKNAQANNVRIDTGTGNTLRFTNLRAQDWDQAVATTPGIEAATGNTVIIDPAPLMTTSGGATGAKYGGAGKIYTDDNWIEYTPATVASTAGTITTVGAKTANYKLRGDQVTVNFDITITTNGTGSGALTFTLPFTAIATGTVQRFVGTGRELVVGGKQLTVTVVPSGTTAQIVDYVNAYPAADTARMVGTITYRKAA
jgi:hypothetical protein